MPKEKLSEWRTEGLRLTAFTLNPIDLEEVARWADLTGEEPDISQARPRDKVLVEAGPYLGGWLTLELGAMRVDWRLAVNPNEPPAELMVLESFGVLREKFRGLMGKWLKRSPPMKRLAFGAVLLLPVDSMVDGYKQLDRLLPSVKIDAENSSDINYRINRRRPSKSGIAGLEINRLSTWSVARFRESMWQIPVDEPSQSRVHELGDPVHACRLELDINTVPGSDRRLKKGALASLLDELVEFGSEIASKGDIQ